MENKIKAILAVIISLGASAFITYQLLHNTQFIGILLIATLISIMIIGLYNSFYDYFKNKSNNK